MVEEEERIKDTQAFAEADRMKQVAVTAAEKEAAEALIKRVQMAEADKQAAEIHAQKKLIDADAEKNASAKHSEAKKIMAEAKAAEEAALGMSEAQVMEAKAMAREREGLTEANIIKLKATANEEAGIKDANVLEKKAVAEAKGIEAKAEAVKKQGLAEADVIKEQGLSESEVIKQKGLSEAEVIRQKLEADAQGIHSKAEAMKKLDGVGKEHEEFKLRLQMEKEIELAKIGIQSEIAESQAIVISEALKSANIDIVGGETMFFDNIVGSITQGKKFDRLMDNSNTLTEVKDSLLSGGDGNLADNVRSIINRFGITADNVKDLTVAALIMQMMDKTSDKGLKTTLTEYLNAAVQAGLDNKPASSLGLFK